jgi:hypothetical protein
MLSEVIDIVDPFYYPLKEIEWHILLTLKFRTMGYKGKHPKACYKRGEYLKDLMIRAKKKLELSRNDLIYFGTEEYNESLEYHIHTVIHVKKPLDTPVETVRRTIMDIISPKIIIIPPPIRGSHPSHRLYRHCEIADSSDKTLKYINKIKQSYDSGKRIFHDEQKNFVQFVKGYRENKARGTLYPSPPEKAVIGQPRSGKRYFIEPFTSLPENNS